MEVERVEAMMTIGHPAVDAALQEYDLLPASEKEGSARPNSRSIENALLVLKSLGDMKPTDVLPSSEGGISVCFVLKDGRSGYFECLNTGTLLWAVSDCRDEQHPVIYASHPIAGAREIEHAVETIARFLGYRPMPRLPVGAGLQI